jgi:integrase
MQRLVLEEVDMFKESIKSKETLQQYETQRELYLEHDPPALTASSEALTNHVAKYLTAMKKRGYSYSYRNIARAAIKHYYKSKKAKLDWDEINSVMGETDRKYSPIGPTVEQVRILLDKADIKKKAIILILISTGMRAAALCQMKLEDMMYIEEYKLYKFRVYKGSVRHEHVTFCTPEAAEAIRVYLRQEKPKVYLLPGEKGRKYMSSRGLSTKIRDLIISTGLGKKTPGKTSVRDKFAALHGFKHFCITQMARAKVDFTMRCIMTDQSGKLGVSQRYTHEMDDELLQEYLKAVPKLTIYEKYQPPVINKIDSQVSELRKENKELREQIATISKQTDDVRNSLYHFMDIVERGEGQLFLRYLEQNFEKSFRKSMAKIDKRVKARNIKLPADNDDDKKAIKQIINDVGQEMRKEIVGGGGANTLTQKETEMLTKEITRDLKRKRVV